MLEAFRLGQTILNPPFILPPMAGVTNRAFRLLCHEQGAALVFTEMVSDRGLLEGNERTEELLAHGPDEGPVGVQLFGSGADTMAEATRIVADRGFACIDVNMGCPAPKIARGSEAGAALMRDPGRAYDIVRAMVSEVGTELPVTAKMRAGWDATTVNAVEVARAVVEAGAAMVSVHGRTREQMYEGSSDPDIIAAVKEAVSVPVCGSGDVFDPVAALTLADTTGCDGVMFARGALGNPWIFARTSVLLATGQLPPEPTPLERLNMVLRHLDLLVDTKDEYRGVREMRKHGAWYTKGLPDSSSFRRSINRAQSKEEFRAIVLNYAREFGGGDDLRKLQGSFR